MLTLSMNDSELKKFFNVMWSNGLKEMPDYEFPDREPSVCLRCNCDITWHTSCGCGDDMAVIDEDGWDDDER